MDSEDLLARTLLHQINEEIDREILANLQTTSAWAHTWDFQTALGDTIREFYAGQFVRVVEIHNVVNRRPLPGGIRVPTIEQVNWLTDGF